MNHFVCFVVILVVLYSEFIVQSEVIVSKENNVTVEEKQDYEARYEVTMTISLEHDELFNASRGVIFREIRLIPNVVTKIDLQNFEDYDDGFGVVHVHGYGNAEFQIAFIDDNDKIPSQTNNGIEKGRHLGFVVLKRDMSFMIYGDYTESLLVLFAFVFYNNTVPVPGGCNQESDNEISPMLQVHHELYSRLIEIDTPAAAVNRNNLRFPKNCWTHNITYEMRFRYIEPRNIRSYFRILKRAMLGKDLTKWRKADLSPPQQPILRRLYKESLTSDLFVMTYISNGVDNHWSSYIPNVISASPSERSAEKLRILPVCLTLLILGTFILFFNSNTGKNISPFFAGIEIGAFVIWTSCLINAASIGVSKQHLIPLIGVGIGLTFGVVWCLALPVLHRCSFLIVMLYKFVASYILTCYTLYFIGDEPFIVPNIIYWEVFFILMSFYTILLLTFMSQSKLVTEILLGSLYIFISINYLAQSGLKNAIYYNYARVAVQYWNYAYGNTHLSLQDYFIIAFAMMVFVLSLMWRMYRSETWATLGENNRLLPDERQPLLSRLTDPSEADASSIFESLRRNCQIPGQIPRKKMHWYGHRRSETS